jgi:hypothetical protein
MNRTNRMQTGEVVPTDLKLDKEDNNGPWILTAPDDVNGAVILRLRITVDGPEDWVGFRAEVEKPGKPPVVVGKFYLSPMEIFPRDSPRHDGLEEPWEPSEEDDFLDIPIEYRGTFAAMVRSWGRIAGMVVPASGGDPATIDD